MLSREGGGRTAVIDIGSNSIRLVVFERLARVLATIFNEKVLCGLANGLDTTGRLSPDGVVLALGNLMRFSALLEAMAVEDVTVLATSAVRDASDGPAFVAEVKARAGLDIRIISGEEEAILAGKGVISGIPDALGVVGDLGGGSLELIGIGGGEVGQNATLPLGPLRLQYYNDLALPVRLYVRRLLHGQTWLFEQRGRDAQGTRQDVGRHIRQPDDRLPSQHRHDEGQRSVPRSQAAALHGRGGRCLGSAGAKRQCHHL